MNNAVMTIDLQGLILAFLPAAVVIGILFRWTTNARDAAYATVRMLIQLLLVGYVLVFIFDAEQSGIVIGVLVTMLVVASWIAIRPLQDKQPRLYLYALGSISLGCIPTLALVTQGVIDIEPWFNPRYVIPLAGMIFGSSMNTVSLAAERFQTEKDRQTPYLEARRIALQTALIPAINWLFAVGLVSIPGMMTGQILAGGSPVVAAKYQIVVMTMLFGASGMSAATYLLLTSVNRPIAEQERK